MDENPIKSGLTLEQKLGFVFLFIFTIFFLIIGFFQIRNNLYRPYALSDAVPEILVREKFSDPIEALHYRDTDRDGLTDFEEIYIYGTSAYLADTDGDGINDKDEILQGKNPLCAEGSPCDRKEESHTPIQNLENWIKNPESQGSLFDMSAILNNPEQIRLLLTSSGVDANLLANFSDEEILQLGQEIFTSEDFQTAMNIQMSSVSKGSSEKTLSKEELLANPLLLREMILETGYVDKESLDKLSDEEVKKAAEQMFDFSQ